MPTYQFVCKDCKEDFEFFLNRILKDEDKVCPSCASKNVQRVYKDFAGILNSRSFGGNAGCGSTRSPFR